MNESIVSKVERKFEDALKKVVDVNSDEVTRLSTDEDMNETKVIDNMLGSKTFESFEKNKNGVRFCRSIIWLRFFLLWYLLQQQSS